MGGGRGGWEVDEVGGLKTRSQIETLFVLFLLLSQTIFEFVSVGWRVWGGALRGEEEEL